MDPEQGRRRWPTVAGAAGFALVMITVARQWPVAFVPVLAAVGVAAALYFLVRMIEERRRRLG